MITKDTKVVCLGGGIGTVNLISGLKNITENITVIVSTADDGGSAGRLRRLYNITPPGDAVSCLAALIPDDREIHKKLLTYRFPGDRYGKDEELSGQKLGSLMVVAAREITGSFEGALDYLKQIFHAHGTILPATKENLNLSAVTIEGVQVDSEENIDLGKYEGERVLEKVSISPSNPTVPDDVIKALEEADVIITGPGDLYTTILPILLIPKVSEFLHKSDKPKAYILNVANKPFETKGYKTSDFISHIRKHIGGFPFTHVITNDNTEVQIPEKFQYTYVENDLKKEDISFELVSCDLIDTKFPLYHDSIKLASKVAETL